MTTPASHYFALQASWGLTKHMGGLAATRQLAETCHIDNNSYVLDVGCGVGITPCYLAEVYGCRVMGIDLSEMMIQRSRERAEKKKVTGKVEFRTADASNLPFGDGQFDAVITESVVAFSKDKQKVLDEFARVTKPGGYAGINEVTWLKTPPASMVKYLGNALGGAEFLTAEGWRSLFEKAGLSDVSAESFKMNAIRQWSSEVQQIDWGDFLNAYKSLFTLFFRDPDLRKWIWSIMFPPPSVFSLFRYFGYGIYAGRKTAG